MTLHDQLVAIAACRDAVEWVGTRPILILGLLVCIALARLL